MQHVITNTVQSFQRSDWIDDPSPIYFSSFSWFEMRAHHPRRKNDRAL